MKHNIRREVFCKVCRRVHLHIDGVCQTCRAKNFIQLRSGVLRRIRAQVAQERTVRAAPLPIYRRIEDLPRYVPPPVAPRRVVEAPRPVRPPVKAVRAGGAKCVCCGDRTRERHPIVEGDLPLPLCGGCQAKL